MDNLGNKKRMTSYVHSLLEDTPKNTKQFPVIKNELTEQDLVARGKVVNDTNKKLVLPRLVSGFVNLMGNASEMRGTPTTNIGADILPSLTNAYIKKEEEKITQAKDLSGYSDREQANVYDKIPNENILSRLFGDGNGTKKALQTMKQTIQPVKDNVVRGDAMTAIANKGLYDDFKKAFTDTPSTIGVNSLNPTISNGLSNFEEKQRISKITGISVDDLQSLADTLSREGKLAIAKIQGDKAPVISSAISVPKNIKGGIEGTAYSLGSLLTGSPIQTDNKAFLEKEETSTIRDTVTDKIKNPVGKFAYQTGMSIADSLASQALGGGSLGTVIMGTQAYSDAVKEGAERGLTPNQIQTTALASGAFEYLFEKISWDKIKLIAKGNASKNVVANIASQMVTEGGEEIGTDMANTLMDNLVNGGASKMAQSYDYYVSQGMSDKQAQKKVMSDYAKQLGLSGLGGAISGGVVGGGASVFNKVTTPKSNVPTIADYQTSPVQQEVKQVPTIADFQKEQQDVKALTPVPVLNTENIQKQVKETPALNQPIQNTVNNEIAPILNETGNAKQIIGGKVSKVRTNTDANSGIHTEEEGKQYLPEEDFTYQPITDDQSIEIARENFKKFGTEYIDKLMSVDNDSLSGSDVDLLMSAYTSHVREARETNDTELWSMARNILKKVQTISTKNGQAIQALAKWSRKTPEGEFMEAMNIVNQSVAKRTGKKNADKFVEDLDPKLQAKVLQLLNEAKKYSVDSREAKVLKARAGKMIAETLPKTIRGRVSQILYNNMLGNVKTLLSRNMGGNLGVAITEQARQPLASLLDKAISQATGVRTTTGWSAEKQGAYIKGFAKGLSEEIDDFKLGMKDYFKGGKTGLHTAKDGHNTLKENLKLNESAFKGNNILSKLQNFKNDLVKNGLSLGDRPFYEATKAQAKVEINKLLKKNQIDTHGLKIDEYIEQASDLIALEAVYQGDTKLSEGFKKIRNGLSEAAQGIIGFDPLTQVTMPFVKTPSNVIEMSLQYSPFGAIKNLLSTVTELKKGEFNQRRFVDETSRNIVGTAILGACVALFMGGLTTGGYDEDKDIKNAQKQAGMQEYALKVGDKNIDLGWVPVVGQLIESGASIGDNMQKGKNIGEIASGAFGQSVQSVLDQSMLSGVTDLLSTNNSNKSVPSNIAYNVASGLAGQLTPSWLRQVAQSTDANERFLGQYGTPEYILNSTKNNIPFLRQTLDKKYDNEGNEVLQNQGRGTGSKFLENMLLPGKVTEIDDSEITNESMRLYESTGLKTQFIPTASLNDIKINGYEPTTEDFNNYKQILGAYNSESASALIGSDYYQSIDDTKKADTLQDLYSTMKQLARSASLPNYEVPESYAKKVSVYEEKGIDGLINYMNISGAREKDNTKGTLDVIRSLDISDEEKGYYVDIFVSSSKAAQAIQSYYGDKGLYDWYNMRTSADYDGSGNVGSDVMTYQIIKSGMPYEDMLNYASVLFEDSKKATAREKAADKIAEVQSNYQKYAMQEYVRSLLGETEKPKNENSYMDLVGSMTPTENSQKNSDEQYQEMLSYVKQLLGK